MDEYDKLIAKKNSLENFIAEVNLRKKKSLDLLIKIRREIALLTHQSIDYPDSTKIPERLSQCDELLNKTLNIATEIDQTLFSHLEQQTQLGIALKQLENVNSSKTTGPG